MHASMQVAAGAGMIPSTPAVVPPALPAYVPIVLDGRLIGHIQSGAALLQFLPQTHLLPQICVCVSSCPHSMITLLPRLFMTIDTCKDVQGSLWCIPGT